MSALHYGGQEVRQPTHAAIGLTQVKILTGAGLSVFFFR